MRVPPHAPDDAGDDRVEQPQRADQHARPAAAAVQRERAEREGGHHGEEGGPARVPERGHREQREPSHRPGRGPGPQPAARRLRGEERGQRGGHGHDQEVHPEPVAQEERAQEGGGQDRPEYGGADQGWWGWPEPGRHAVVLGDGRPGAVLPGVPRLPGLLSGLGRLAPAVVSLRRGRPRGIGRRRPGGPRLGRPRFVGCRRVGGLGDRRRFRWPGRVGCPWFLRRSGRLGRLIGHGTPPPPGPRAALGRTPVPASHSAHALKIN